MVHRKLRDSTQELSLAQHQQQDRGKELSQCKGKLKESQEKCKVLVHVGIWPAGVHRAEQRPMRGQHQVLQVLQHQVCFGNAPQEVGVDTLGWPGRAALATCLCSR